MAGPLKISDRVEIPEEELEWRFSRASGPGGQSVNTSSTRVELRFDLAQSGAFPPYLHERALANLAGRFPSGIVTVVASEQRSQHKNRLAAEERLRDLLGQAIAPPPAKRRPTKPTKSSSQERISTKRHRGEIKRLRRYKSDD